MDAETTADQPTAGNTEPEDVATAGAAQDAEPATEPTDRLFGGIALGLMGLLLLCVVLVLIAWSRG